MPSPTLDRGMFADLLASWGLRYARTRPEIPLVGSPERTEFRVAVEDMEGRVYVLERIAPEKRAWRRCINAVLLTLAERGLHAIHPYLLNRRESSITERDGTFWQVMPFITGEELPRPDYVFDARRGRKAAEFLLQLRDLSSALPMVPAQEFSIVDYARDLTGRFRRHRPALAQDLKQTRDFLESHFAPIHDRLPPAFCHGDFHPLNIIWGTDGLNSVLDWEFMGMKPEVFDAANLIGCAGMDRPDALLADFVLSFIATLREGGFFRTPSLRYLPEYVLALRYGWMREWVKRDEREMITLELDFMHLLMDNRERIRERWSG